jgi:hypothetical protein
MTIRASRDDVLRLRLARHGLAGNDLRTPVEVVQRMLALQSQDFPAGKWAVGARAPGTTLADVNAAIDSGEIVRSWPMRGTLHLVPARELGWMLQITTPRLLTGAKTRRAQLNLDDASIEHSRDVARGALAGGRGLTRAQFLQTLEDAGIDTAGQRGYHIIGILAQTGTLCWGPHEGKQQLIVLLDEWVPNPRRLDRDEALGEFLVRYLDGHGPATLKDFAWWSKVTIAEAKTGLAVAGDRLSEVQVDDTTYYLPASVDTAPLGDQPHQRSAVLTLAGFDEYLLAYGDRSLVIDEQDFTRVVPGKNGIFFPVVVQSGRVIGTWRITSARSAMTAGAELFKPTDSSLDDAFAASIGEYAAFLGKPVTVPEQAVSCASVSLN